MVWNRRIRNKAGNTRTKTDGYSFASKLEAAVYQILKLREKAGEIEIIKTQNIIELTEAKIKWRADFLCEYLPSRERFLVEAKGYEDLRWAVIYKLLGFYCHHKVEIWMGSYKKPFLKEIIVPK